MGLVSLKEDSYFQQVYNYYLQNIPEVLRLWGLHPDNFDFEDFFDKLVTASKVQDISVDPTANVESRNISRVRTELSKPYLKYLTFKYLFKKMVELYGLKDSTEYALRLLNGTYYLHDSAHLSCYCLGADFSRILLEGMPWGRLHSFQPKKPRVFINQVKECVIELSHEFAGSIAFPSLILLYTYIYLKYYGKGELKVKEIIDDFQNLVHTVNKELRNSQEPPFTNLSFFDRYILDELITYVYNWMFQDVSKEDLLEYTIKIQEIVMEFLCAGDPKTGSPYRFPILTANFVKDKKTGEILDKDFLDLVARNNTKGQMNIYISADSRAFSFCCRYNSSYEHLKFDSFGNGGVNTGSLRVLTINLNRLALDTLKVIEESGDTKDEATIEDTFLSILYERMYNAKRILDAFRETIRDFINRGLYKFFNLGWFDLDKHFFSTIGFVGLYEAMETLGYSIFSDFAKEVLSAMDSTIKQFNKGSNWRYNLEQIPGESACSLLPKLDALFYGRKKVPYVLYANQFIPLYIEHSLLDKIDVEGKFFKYLSGGGISHINILSEMTPEQVKFMIDLCTKRGIEHFALNPVFSICENNHYTLGKVEKCPICNKPIVDYCSRIVGYFVPISKWQKERRDWEFERRHWFNLNVAEEC